MKRLLQSLCIAAAIAVLGACEAPDRGVHVADVTFDDGVVSGVVRNDSEQPVRDVTLSIEHHFRAGPGVRPSADQTPLRQTHVLQGEIAPGQTREFSVPSPSDVPLPGEESEFETRVEVVGSGGSAQSS
jgi:hypothetical protein